MGNTPLAVVRACLQAYVRNDRRGLELLLDPEYRFTSPIDNALDRETYMRICWPNSAAITGFDLIHEAEDGNRAFIVYEGRTSAGKRFRNCEMHTARDGKLLRTEVYFGWDVPHKVPVGGHVDDRDAR
jgi:hypothetical protein